MALILCHHCLSWVEPIGEQCPQCDFPVDARSPDPPLEELSAALGQIVGRIGEVRIARTSLPDRGSLYETTNGLFFVPHRLEQVKLAKSPPSRMSWRRFLMEACGWPFQVFFAAPSAGTARMEIAVDEPRPLGPDDSERMPWLLMQNPGVFFLARRSIQDVRWTLRGWTISRPNSLVLRLKPLIDRGRFHERMAKWAARVHEAVCP